MATQIDLGAVVPIGKGDWNSSTTYERANIVRHNSTAWVCKVATSTGVEPTDNSSDWYLLVRDTSSVTSVNGMRGDVIVDIVNTPDADDNSNKIANTEWVKRYVKTATNNTIGMVKAGTGITIGSDGSANVNIFKGSDEGLIPSATSTNSDSVLRGNGTWSNIGLDPISEKLQNIGDISGDKVIDLSLGLYIVGTITEATTLSFTNTPSGAVIVILQLTNGGSYTITWPTSIKWSGGVAPELTATGTDIIILTTNNSGTAWYGVANLEYA